MAGTTRAASPRTEPFPPLDANPRTPTSITFTTEAAPIGGPENPNLLKPRDPTGLSPKTDRRTLSPPPLSGAAAIAELRRQQQEKQRQEQGQGGSRQTSPNPAVQAMQKLMGGSAGFSKPSDAPVATQLSEPVQKAAEKMTVDSGNADSNQASPVSLSSFGTLESTGAGGSLTATAHNGTSDIPFVAEPAQMTESASSADAKANLTVDENAASVRPFSYPGSRVQEQVQEAPSRGMTLPGYGQGSPKSPASSNKRHKCPYCSTDFTRHHNLKSHLLTHSQEKPYVCQTCQARFRRLHDLKRHTKLHTGERPHTCDKCGRKFARGDALARHNKGPGGCAGRRSSFGGEDDFGEGGVEGMGGVEYEGDDASSPDNGRRVSEPSRKRTHLERPHDANRQVYRQHSSTYPPPPQTRPHAGSLGNMGPPQVVLSGSHAATSPRDVSGQPSPTAGGSMSSVYYTGQVLPHQTGMIESPKPLSPGQPPAQDQHRLSVGDGSHSSQMLRHRSPSLTAQFQQTHFGRGSGLRTPPQASYPPTSHHAHPQTQAPVLPPLSGQQQSRPAPQPPMQPGPGPSMLHHTQVPPTNPAPPGVGSHQGSLSSHGRSSGSSIRDVVGQDPGELWTYIRNLESRFNRMQDEYELRISRLQEELISLRGQVTNAASYSSEMAQQPRY